MIERNEIKGLNMHLGAHKQTHQQFVDDTMLKGHPSVMEAGVFKKCMNSFARASGLEIN